MSLEPLDYLRHILAETDYFLNQRTGLSFERFVVDETLRRAFVRSLEIIGKAAKKVPADFRAQHPTIGWRPHDRDARSADSADYFGVDYELVWDLVQNRVSPLRAQIAMILDR